MTDDIVSRIDDLVDWQLEQGDTSHPDVCSRCGFDWHLMPLTMRVARMVRLAEYDEAYSIREDDTQILCLPQDEQGPSLFRAEWSDLCGDWHVDMSPVIADEWEAVDVEVFEAISSCFHPVRSGPDCAVCG